MLRSQSMAIMKDTSNEKKFSYMFYEAAGTFFICYGYNLYP